VVTCCALLAVPAYAQDATPVFRATSELVLLDVQVIHSKTKTANGALQAKDFQVFEDGSPQEIAFFDRDQLPLSIVFLFDLTDTVRGVLHRLATGAKTVLTHLKPEDEVGVIAYAASARIVDGFTNDRQRTAAAIARAAAMKSHEAAFFNEAIYQATAVLRQSHNPSSRRVIVWLTDNHPNVPSRFNTRLYGRSLDGAPPHTEDEAIHLLHESGTVVTPMLLKDPLALPWAEVATASEALARKRYPPGDAHKYAELTGGLAVGMRGKNVEQRLAEVLDELRSRYTIGYQPSASKPPGTFCRLQVALSAEAPLRPQEWTVLARAGYYRK
jgi:Ca-activated chloride channel family protein